MSLIAEEGVWLVLLWSEGGGGGGGGDLRDTAVNQPGGMGAEAS